MNQTDKRKLQLHTFFGLCSLFIFFIISKVIGEVGVTYLAVTLLVYLSVYALFGAGASQIISELLLYRKEREQYKNLLRMKQVAFLFQIIVGGVFGLILFFCAPVLATMLFKIPSLALLLRLIALLIPIRLLIAVFEGVFIAGELELHGLVIKTANLILSLVFSGLLIGGLGEYGQKVSELLNQKNARILYLVAAVILAILISQICALIAYVVIYYNQKTKRPLPATEGMRLTESKSYCIKTLFRKRIPYIIEQFYVLLPVLLPFVYWNNHTDRVDGILAYGTFLGQFVFFAIVIAHLFHLSAKPLLGTISLHLEKKENRHARYGFHLSMHACVANGIFASVFLTVMAKHIASTFSVNGATLFENMLKTCSIFMLLACVFVYLYDFLTLLQFKKGIMLAVGAGNVILLIGIVVLTLIRKTFPLAPVVLTICSVFISCVCMWLIAFRQMRLNFDWMRAFVIPLGVGCAVGLVAMLFSKIFTPHLGVFFTLCMTFVITLLLYWLILLLIQNFTKKDLSILPAGRGLIILAKIFHLY